MIVPVRFHRHDIAVACCPDGRLRGLALQGRPPMPVQQVGRGREVCIETAAAVRLIDADVAPGGGTRNHFEAVHRVPGIVVHAVLTRWSPGDLLDVIA